VAGCSSPLADCWIMPLERTPERGHGEQPLGEQAVVGTGADDGGGGRDPVLTEADANAGDDLAAGRGSGEKQIAV